MPDVLLLSTPSVLCPRLGKRKRFLWVGHGGDGSCIAGVLLHPSLAVFTLSLSVHGSVSVAIVELLLQTPCLTLRENVLLGCASPCGMEGYVLFHEENQGRARLSSLIIAVNQGSGGKLLSFGLVIELTVFLSF